MDQALHTVQVDQALHLIHTVQLDQALQVDQALHLIHTSYFRGGSSTHKWIKRSVPSTISIFFAWYTSTPYGPPHSNGTETLKYALGCFGCKNQYEKNLKPPNQEWSEFIPTGSRKKFSNVYYHCNPQCVWLRWGSFNPSSIILSDIVSELTEVQKNFGV